MWLYFKCTSFSKTMSSLLVNGEVIWQASDSSLTKDIHANRYGREIFWPQVKRIKLKISRQALSDWIWHMDQSRHKAKLFNYLLARSAIIPSKFLSSVERSSSCRFFFATFSSVSIFLSSIWVFVMWRQNVNKSNFVNQSKINTNSQLQPRLCLRQRTTLVNIWGRPLWSKHEQCYQLLIICFYPLLLWVTTPMYPPAPPRFLAYSCGQDRCVLSFNDLNKQRSIWEKATTDIYIMRLKQRDGIYSIPLV